jgi:hypothetical protein
MTQNREDVGMKTRDEGIRYDMRFAMAEGYTSPRCTPTFSHFFLAARHPIFSMGVLSALDASRPGRPMFWAIVTTADANRRGKTHQEETRMEFPEFEHRRRVEAARHEVIEAGRRIGVELHQSRCMAEWAKLIDPGQK